MTGDGAETAGLDAENTALPSHYGEDAFDELIATVCKNPEKAPGPTPTQEEDVEEEKDDISVDLENLERKDSDLSSSDVASLGSEEIISGGSDISEEVERQKNYVPQPLVNDDESTIDLRPPAPHSQTVSSYVNQLNRQERSKSRLIKAGAFAILVAIVVGIVLAVLSLSGNKNGGGDGSSQVESTTGVATDQTSSRPTSASTTMKPVLPLTTETIHPVQLTFENMPVGYRLPDDEQTSIISFIEELLNDHLDDSFELLDVAYARVGGGVNPRRLLSSRYQNVRRRLENFSLPLRIVVKGPKNFTEDFIREYLIGVLRDQSNDIVTYVQAVDMEAFRNVRVTPETYDFADLIEPTASPSLPPHISLSTASPSLTTQANVSTTSPSWPPISDPPTTRAPVTVTSAPITSAPTTKSPTRYPTKNPTSMPSRYPTARPTPIPTSKPPTKRPTSNPTLILPNESPNPGPSPSSTSTDPTNDYFCAEVSHTENWNLLLDFDCEMPCPSMAHADCPGGYQCRKSDYCAELAR